MLSSANGHNLLLGIDAEHRRSGEKSANTQGVSSGGGILGRYNDLSIPERIVGEVLGIQSVIIGPRFRSSGENLPEYGERSNGQIVVWG